MDTRYYLDFELIWKLTERIFTDGFGVGLTIRQIRMHTTPRRLLRQIKEI